MIFSLRFKYAEDERFELSEDFTPRRFSKPLVSATHPILHSYHPIILRIFKKPKKLFQNLK